VLEDISIAFPPASGIYRVAHSTPGPFAAPLWRYASSDGTFGNRFDDPRSHLPEEERFRVLYCATERRAAFAETLTRVRPSLNVLAEMATIDDDDSFASVVSHTSDPDNSYRGLIRAVWRHQRVVGHTIVNPDLMFADLTTLQTSAHLREALATQALAHGATDIDQSLFMEPRRGFTQEVAHYIYELQNEDGTPRFAGIRYISRLDIRFECWAVFADRMEHVRGMPSLPETIFPDDPDLLEVASIFRLTIETIDGSGHYYRP